VTYFRIGFGFDIHPLVAGRPLVIGGVQIPFEKGLAGHSDADVLVHALMDACLGAAGLGDIGLHFPDTDPHYEGIRSLELLERVAHMLAERGWKLGNADVMLVAEAPKISGHFDDMRINCARCLGADPSCINIKATRCEGLGAVGRGEGIAAYAVALLSGIGNQAGA
jgi:2-C-methyl-D-erythritol 2,4-cyclodiphosphate synthase